jgi:hypothetical protein
MKKQLVEDLLSPKQGGFPRYPADCEVTRREARALTANCLKIAFPTFFFSSFSGESIKNALRYEQHRADLRVANLQRRESQAQRVILALRYASRPCKALRSCGRANLVAKKVKTGRRRILGF